MNAAVVRLLFEQINVRLQIWVSAGGGTKVFMSLNLIDVMFPVLDVQVKIW